MRLSLRHVAVTASSAVVLSALAFAAPANADVWSVAEGDCTGPSLAAAPDHESNAAPVTTADEASVITGGVRIVDVLANDTDADGDELRLVSASSSRYGYTCIDEDELVFVSNRRVPRSGVATLTYAATDGDYYRTGTLALSFEDVAVKKPQVTKKLLVSKGKVTRKATVTFTNPDPTHTVQVYVAAYDQDEWDTIELAPGASSAFVTKRRGLQFLTLVDEPDSGAYLQVGEINTRSGKVYAESAWYIGGEYKSAPKPGDVARRLHR